LLVLPTTGHRAARQSFAATGNLGKIIEIRIRENGNGSAIAEKSE
jgi:hypothetical protein